jgi:hypothetical protein
MSFDVFASGSGGFHYTKDGFIDGDDLDMVKLASEVQSLDPTPLGVADAVKNHYLSKYLSKDMTDAMAVIAQREFLYSLKESVDLLAVRGSADGFITVTAKQKHALWPDTLRFAKYGFDPGDSPGSEFIRAIAKSLDDTDLKTWGVLMALTIVLSKYSEHLDSRDPSLPTMINIFLTH